MFDFITKVHAQVGPTITQLDPGTDLQTIFTNIITWALYVGGAVAVIYIIYGGFTYITAAGDQTKAEQGRNTLTFAIIGIVIIAMSIVIVEWVNQSILGTFH